MTRKPLFSFNSGTDVGIDQVPLNGIIYIEDSDGSGTPQVMALKDKTSITGLTTINELINTYSSQWKHINGETIYDEVIKTVGAGKDFTTLHEAFMWVATTVVAASGIIKLSLDDGVHLLDGSRLFQSSTNLRTFSYKIYSTNLEIYSASGDMSLCKIGVENYTEVVDHALLGIFDGRVYFNNIEIDGGGAANLTLIYCESIMILDIVTIGNANKAVELWNGNLYSHGKEVSVIQNCTTRGVKDGGNCHVMIEGGIFNCAIGVTIFGGAKLFTQGTYENCDLALKLSYGAGLVVQCRWATFTNNTLISEIPFNEIQYNGSYITDETTSLSFKV